MQFLCEWTCCLLFSCKSTSCVLPIFLGINVFTTCLPVNQLVRCPFSCESTCLSIFLWIKLLFVDFSVNQLIVCCFPANLLDVCYLFSCESTGCFLSQQQGAAGGSSGSGSNTSVISPDFFQQAMMTAQSSALEVSEVTNMFAFVFSFPNLTLLW